MTTRTPAPAIPGYQCWNLNALRKIVKRHVADATDLDEALAIIEEVRQACADLRAAHAAEAEARKQLLREPS